MLKAEYRPYTLQFRKPSGTSRGILTEKRSWFLRIYHEEHPEISGIGEAGHLEGLSVETPEQVEHFLQLICRDPEHPYWMENGLLEVPSVRFAYEQAMIDLHEGGKRILFPSEFTGGNSPLSINGLVWMAPIESMREQVREKINAGFTCIKLKIGALNFEDEITLLREIRNEFPATSIEIRVDANGAFTKDDALQKLERLAQLQLHSIEQPIRQGQHREMAELCKHTPLPIALDEELIGIHSNNDKQKLLDIIQPQYIILKPSLLGGIRSCEEWIMASGERDISMWITSALESNIGLNAIAQWTATLHTNMPQGLGTGQLYTNNFPSPLEVAGGHLHYRTNTAWDLSTLF